MKKKNLLSKQVPSRWNSERLVHSQRDLFPGDEHPPEPSVEIPPGDLSTNVSRLWFLSGRKANQLAIAVFDSDGHQRVWRNCKKKKEMEKYITFCS